MGKSKKEPSKPSASIQIGDRTVANAQWDGTKFITQYNPTDSEKSAMNTLQGAIPQAYLDAVDKEGIQRYKQKWINNQTNQLNELANTNLTNLKDNLITGGQIGSSTGWNKIKTFNDSYTDALNDINSNADFQSLAYQQNLLDYANNVQGSMNGYYDLASNFAQNAASNQQSAANQNLNYWQAQQQANASGGGWKNALYNVGKIGATAVGTYFGGALGGMAANKLYGNATDSLAGKTGG